MMSGSKGILLPLIPWIVSHFMLSQSWYHFIALSLEEKKIETLSSGESNGGYRKISHRCKLMTSEASFGLIPHSSFARRFICVLKILTYSKLSVWNKNVRGNLSLII